jgi:hypothetical protein
MANVNSPFGLRIATQYSSSDPKIREYYINSGSVSTNLYPGDPVVITGGGNTTYSLGGAALLPGTKPYITKTTAGSSNYSTGIIVGFRFQPGNLYNAGCNYYTQGNGDMIADVCDDPNEVFEIQDDGVATLTASAVGQNANLIYTNTGNSFTAISGAQLSSASVNTTNTLQLQIVGVSERINNIVGANTTWLVKFNLHTGAPGSTGI